MRLWLQDVLDVARAMENCDDGERRTGWVVHDQIRVDAPELQWSHCEVHSGVSHPRPLSQEPERLLEGIVDEQGGFDVVLSDEIGDRSTSYWALGVSW
jgi:hypothetical protein